MVCSRLDPGGVLNWMKTIPLSEGGKNSAPSRIQVAGIEARTRIRAPVQRSLQMLSSIIARALPFLLVCSLTLVGGAASAASVTINPSADNTIADGVDPGSGEDFTDNSSGACEFLFGGTTADTFARRALLRFNFAGSVPPGSTINSVTLSMTLLPKTASS